MSSSTVTVSSPSSTRERARLALPALIAGVLAVPGSTIAWDLPAGGFWIGVPLAAVAVLLGLMAFPYVEGGKRTMAAVGIVLGAASLLFVLGCTLFA